jgi:DNA-binding transcriptional LysR family regulator
VTHHYFLQDYPELLVESACRGLGLAYAGLDYVRDEITEGKLVRVLADWCPPWPGLLMYYPSRRHVPSALKILIGLLRQAAGLDMGPPRAAS